MSIQNFVKIGQMIQKLKWDTQRPKGRHTNSRLKISSQFIVTSSIIGTFVLRMEEICTDFQEEHNFKMGFVYCGFSTKHFTE